jgi:septal ring factor EnvC (AmiA/AmiB activator)
VLVAHLARCLEDQEALRAAFEELRRTPQRERGQLEARLGELAAQEERLERQRAGVYAMREAGETTHAQFSERRAAVEAELSALRAQIAEVQGYLSQAHGQEGLWTSLEAFCREMAGRLRASERPEHFEHRQRALAALLDAVDVYPDRFDVHGVFGASFARHAQIGR